MHHYEAQFGRVLPSSELSEDQWNIIRHAYLSIEDRALSDWRGTDRDRDEGSLVPKFNQVGSASYTVSDGDVFMTLLDALTTLHTYPRTESSVHNSVVSGSGRCLHPNRHTIIVPVTPIVLRDLPRNLGITPLILANAFEALVSALRSRSHNSRSTGGCYGYDSLTCTTTLDRLQRAATVGWMSIGRPEVGDLYGAEGEMRKIEAWRRELTPAFRGFIDALTGDYRRYVDVPAPLFVVPIDTSGVTRQEQRQELLKLLPLMGHPRALYLINDE